MKADGPEGFLREMTVEPKVEIDRCSTNCSRCPTAHILFVFYLLLVPIAIAIGVFAVPQEFAVKRMDAAELNKWTGMITKSDNIQKINQYLRLKLIATSKFETRVSFEKAIEITVRLDVRDAGQKKWVTVMQTKHARDLICREQKKTCDSIHLLSQIALHSDEYRVDVKLGPGMDPAFVKSIEYVFSYVKSEFTLCEMLVKYLLIAVVLWRVAAFCFRAERAKERLCCVDADSLLEQRLTGFLLIGLLFFNDPLFIFKVLFGGWWIELLSDIMLSAFAVTVLVYILMMSGHLQREQREDKQSVCFYISSIAPALVVLVLTLMLICISKGTIAVDPASDFPSDYGLLYKGLTWMLYGFVIIITAMFLFRLASASFKGLIFFGPSRRQLKDMDELNYFDVTWPEHRRNRFSFFAYTTLMLFALLAVLAIWSNMEFQFSAKALSNKNGAIMFGGLAAINGYVMLNGWAFTAVQASENTQGPKDSDFLGQTSWGPTAQYSERKAFSRRL